MSVSTPDQPSFVMINNFIPVVFCQYQPKSAIMLRRKISAGLLRASASSTSTAVPTLPASPIQLQASGLASAVLLDTQQNWGKETVASLKNELKKRGLSQTGKKYIFTGVQ